MGRILNGFDAIDTLTLATSRWERGFFFCSTASLTPERQTCTLFLYRYSSPQLMSNKVNYTTARANFARLCDAVADNSEVVIINRRGAKDVALVAADELAGLMETAHLLRSPRNARRLLTALKRAQSTKPRPQTVKKLRQDLGIEPRK